MALAIPCGTALPLELTTVAFFLSFWVSADVVELDLIANVLGLSAQDIVNGLHMLQVS